MRNFSDEYIARLARKFNEQTLSPQEAADFKIWFANLDQAGELITEKDPEITKTRLKNAIDAELGFNQHGRFSLANWRIFAAASVLIVFSLGAMLMWLGKDANVNKEILVKVDVAPGGDKAFLKLADGRQIDLNTANSATISALGLVRNAAGELEFKAAANQGDHDFQTLSTPNGGTYTVILPDGTKVWLNAASSLTFPEKFSQLNRKVTLKGEGYFEVAHDSKRPFYVNAGNQEIKVLGTHFNINAYEDETNVVTTLAKGSVSVRTANDFIKIVPGEQATTIRNQGAIKVVPANLAIKLAWKNGMIAFQDETLPDIMRQVARWYNIKVRFVGQPSTELFTGGFSRNSHLSQLLEILEANQIAFTLVQEGNEKILEIGQ